MTPERILELELDPAKIAEMTQARAIERKHASPLILAHSCRKQVFVTRESAIRTAKALSRMQIHCDWFKCGTCGQIHLELMA